MIVRRWLVLFGLALICTLPAQKGASQPRTSPEETMNRGEFNSQLQLAQAYEQMGNLTDATRIFQQLYKVDPNSYEVLDGLVRCFVGGKHYEEAERSLKQLLERGPNLQLTLLLARIEAKLNKHKDALAAFSQAEGMLGSNASCEEILPVAFGMIEVSYNDDALELLNRFRSHSEGDICASQIAGLYLRLGKYDRAAKEYLTLLANGENNVQIVEQRLSQFMTDSLARTLITDSVRAAVDRSKPTPSALQLLGWLYGEEHNYNEALNVMLRMDSATAEIRGTNRGYDLYLFAERVRNEGALDVAVRAYDEAIKRLHASGGREQMFFISQAELGSLHTKKKYVLSKPEHTKADVEEVVSQYERFAAAAPSGDIACDAFLSAGSLSLNQLHDVPRATKDYEAAAIKSGGGSDRSRDALFGLVEAALSEGDMAKANSRIDAAEQLLNARRRPSDQEGRMHVAYSRALVQYYIEQFDSALALLTIVTANPSSDFANDAIMLSSIIQENNTPEFLTALQLYSKAALAEQTHDMTTAMSAYQMIVETYPTTPIADDADVRFAEMQLKLDKPTEAVRTLETMQEKMPNSPLLDQAFFRMAEIVEKNLRDKPRAQHLYEDFLGRFPRSSFVSEARNRARRLRGDVF